MPVTTPRSARPSAHLAAIFCAILVLALVLALGACSNLTELNPYRGFTPSDEWKAAQADALSDSYVAPGDEMCPRLIEGRVVGDFEGWKPNAVFKLTNGQYWQQISPLKEDYSAYAPKVIIYPAEKKFCLMKIDGLEHPVAVKRLR